MRRRRRWKPPSGANWSPRPVVGRSPTWDFESRGEERGMTENAAGRRAGASKEAIQAHYDVGNGFYRLWLDATLTYSCALWAGDDDTLEAAQRRKLDYIADPALAHGAEHVLD